MCVLLIISGVWPNSDFKPQLGHIDFLSLAPKTQRSIKFEEGQQCLMQQVSFFESSCIRVCVSY